MIKTVCFDLDNTLYDYDSAHKIGVEELFKASIKYLGINNLEEFKRLYKNAQMEVKRELAGTAASHSRALYLQRLFEHQHNTVRPKIILELYETYWSTHIKNMKLLEYLRNKQLKVILVTNLTTHVTVRRLDALGIEDYIDHLVTSEEAGVEKPHPGIFLIALNKTRTLPHEAMFVGDTPTTDLEGANSVGMTSVHLRFGKYKDMTEFTEYQKPNYSVSSLREINDLIERS